MATATNPRLKALQNLSSQLPVANQRVAQGQAAARDIQLQQAVKAAPPQANVQQTAQQTGAAAASQAGQQMIQAAQQNQQQQGQIGQLGVAAQQQQAQANVAGLESGAREQSMNNVQRLASISEKAKQELYDKQMNFQKDEQGRTLFNDRQLMDYAKANAQSEQDYLSKAQAMKQASDREMQVMEHSYNLINQDLENRIRLAEQKKDQKLQMELAEMKRAADEQMAKKRNASNNRAQMFQAGGMIVGAVAGGVLGSMAAPGVGTVAGASAGASLGGAMGGMAASQTDNTKA